MPIRTRTFLTIGLLLISITPALAATLPNGAFEFATSDGTAPAGWRPVAGMAGEAAVDLAWSDLAHNGERSIAITVDPAADVAPGAYNWATDITDFQVGATYEVSAWARSESLTSTASLVVQCWDEDRSEILAFGTTEAGYRLTGTMDWTRSE